MPVAIPFIAAAAGAAASAVIGGGVLGAVETAGAALVVSAAGAAAFRPKSPSAARSANVTPGTDTAPGSGFDPRTPGAGRTQSFRQPITEHQIVFGRCRTSGLVVFLRSATDDEGHAEGFLHVVVVLAAHRVGAGVAFAQVGIVGFDGQIELEALRLFGLPEAASAVLYDCPSVPVGTRSLALETTWDLPSLHRRRDGEHRRDRAGSEARRLRRCVA